MLKSTSDLVRKPGLILAALSMAVSLPVSAQPAADAPSQAAANGMRSASAVVNGEIVTGSDIDERLALVLNAEGQSDLTAEQRSLARQQVLANLVDEKLQIQAAEAKDIVISDAQIDQMFTAMAERNQTPSIEEFSDQLYSMGSSPRSLKQQIKAELAWSRLLNREVSPYVNVSEDEVNSVLERLQEAKGTTEVRIGEIYLSATPQTENEVLKTARTIIESIQQGGSFAAFARQFSQASTASRGGDLGWVRPAMLPDSFVNTLQSIEVGQIAGPIPAPGGLSILYLIDRRQVLGADRENTLLSLKQIYIDFAKDMPEAEADRTIQQFADAVSGIKGCDDAEAIAGKLGAGIISRDDIRIGDLPGPLQAIMEKMPVGQATSPYGAANDGVRAFVLCGREVPQQAGMPSAADIRENLEQDRINKKARIYLRDLRQDAIIRYN